MRRFFYICFCSLWACARPDEYAPSPQLYVQGWLSNELQQHSLKIHHISPLDTPALRPEHRVQQLYIEDEQHADHAYVYDPIRSLYTLQEGRSATPATRYRLRFQWQGAAYASGFDTLARAPRIVSYRITSTRCPNGQPSDASCYIVFVTLQDPLEDSYYRWLIDPQMRPLDAQFWRNSVFSDAQFRGEIVDRRVGLFASASGEDLKLSLCAMTAKTYAYLSATLPYLDPQQTYNWLVPTTAQGNIYRLDGDGVAVGYFGLMNIQNLYLRAP